MPVCTKENISRRGNNLQLRELIEALRGDCFLRCDQFLFLFFKAIVTFFYFIMCLSQCISQFCPFSPDKVVENVFYQFCDSQEPSEDVNMSEATASSSVDHRVRFTGSLINKLSVCKQFTQIEPLPTTLSYKLEREH